MPSIGLVTTAVPELQQRGTEDFARDSPCHWGAAESPLSSFVTSSFLATVVSQLEALLSSSAVEVDRSSISKHMYVNTNLEYH